MIFVILPVKAARRAKQRLAGVLTAAERERLALLMYERTLQVLLGWNDVDRVLVASSDDAVLAAAALRHAVILPEASQLSHSDSADRAARHAMRLGARSVLLVPIDVPLLETRDLELVLQAGGATGPGVAIVPSADGTGTNALFETPPGALESRFGPGSFAAHTAQARERSLCCEVVRAPGLMFDLDGPADVLEYLARNPRGPVADYLRSIEAAERIHRRGGESAHRSSRPI